MIRNRPRTGSRRVEGAAEIPLMESIGLRSLPYSGGANDSQRWSARHGFQNVLQHRV